MVLLLVLLFQGWLLIVLIILELPKDHLKGRLTVLLLPVLMFLPISPLKDHHLIVHPPIMECIPTILLILLPITILKLIITMVQIQTILHLSVPIVRLPLVTLIFNRLIRQFLPSPTKIKTKAVMIIKNQSIQNKERKLKRVFAIFFILSSNSIKMKLDPLS